MKCSVFIATSLDGFIARLNGDIDWLPNGESVEEHGYQTLMDSVDVLVMGRNTFELVLSFDAWPYESKPVIVLSSRPLTLPSTVPATVEVLQQSPDQLIKTLEARGAKHIYVDGGVTIQRFIAAGLIDRIIITRIPVLIGSGIPLFGKLPHDVTLKHVATRAFASGLVQSEYNIATVPGATAYDATT